MFVLFSAFEIYWNLPYPLWVFDPTRNNQAKTPQNLINSSPDVLKIRYLIVIFLVFSNFLTTKIGNPATRTHGQRISSEPSLGRVRGRKWIWWPSWISASWIKYIKVNQRRFRDPIPRNSRQFRNIHELFSNLPVLCPDAFFLKKKVDSFFNTPWQCSEEKVR